MTLRTGIGLAAILGAAVLAYQIGARLSDEALITIAGVLCGIVASIPVSLGLVIALTREREHRAAEYQVEREPSVWVDPDPTMYPPPPRPSFPLSPLPGYPPIYLVAPPQATLPANYLPYPPASNPVPPPPIERDFKIVGDEEDEV